MAKTRSCPRGSSSHRSKWSLRATEQVAHRKRGFWARQGPVGSTASLKGGVAEEVQLSKPPRGRRGRSDEWTWYLTLLAKCSALLSHVLASCFALSIFGRPPVFPLTTAVPDLGNKQSPQKCRDRTGLTLRQRSREHLLRPWSFISPSSRHLMSACQTTRPSNAHRRVPTFRCTVGLMASRPLVPWLLPPDTDEPITHSDPGRSRNSIGSQ